jgi:2-amino-4-hydroxy-6-hydroxymethyldihydropteridine diphosphokinase
MAGADSHVNETPLRVAVALGSNLGDRRAILDEAVARLASTHGLRLQAVSRYVETSPVGGPENQGAFLNAAATFESAIGPEALLDELRRIEAQAHRVREVRWGARTLDLDLLLAGGLVLNKPGLTLPHPRMLVRRFVLGPLAEIAADWLEPMTGHTIEACRAHLDRRPLYVALHGSDSDLRDAVLHRLVERLGATIPAPTPILEPRPADTLATRALDLDAADWPDHRTGDRWLVTPYCIDLDYRRARAVAIAHLLHPPRTQNGHPTHHDEADDVELDLMVRSALSPTFAVALPAPDQPRFAPGLADFPILWPDSADTEGIVDEILAACESVHST